MDKYECAQKYQGKNNLWDALNNMDELGLDHEALKSELFNYFSSDDLKGFIEHLEHEGYTID